ncbi:SIR2-domain-containing protein [Daedalea quercina L-15889]|uniref:SIR2-domain-containing protein n=1 Tax=Daedalea quercina L-15889 TaxID=1314783 RepID=A0A165RHN8_9APHY|nr:SIR2-domain-containing protein [Daedalea quercina L-15889]
MDRRPPTQTQGGVRSSSRSATTTAKRRFRHIYALQLQGFIEAAEVVDTDPDVIEGLLEDLARITTLEGSNDDDEVDVGNTPPNDIDSEDEEASEWDALLTEAQSAWTTEEVKQMMRILKEDGIAAYIKEYVVGRSIPVYKLLYAFGICLCPELRAKSARTRLYFLNVAMTRELESRKKQPQYNTVDDAVRLIQQRKRILVLTGAGISVSCGIPDFRSRNGLYASLQESGEYDLDDPQQMFDITYFREKPTVFSSFASKIYPSNFVPSPCHRFIKAIEDRGKLLRNYTQNIDTLETLAGVKRVLQCHGSFATASCLNCKIRVPGTAIEDDILNQRVPLCRVCNAVPQPNLPVKHKGRKKRRKGSGWNSDESDEPDKPQFPPGIMKPDITFFGEKLSDDFDRALLEDRQQIDLLIIIGTSLKVSPVSDIIAHLPHSVPQILINKTPIRHINPDIVLLGNADDVILHLCRKLGWELPSPNGRNLAAPSSYSLKKRPSADLDTEPRRVGDRYVVRLQGLHVRILTTTNDSHVWLFEGAEGGKWVEDLAQRCADTPEGSSSDDADVTPPRTPNPRQKSKRARRE